MLTKHYCKDCFKTLIDDQAKDAFLLMSGDNMRCPCCGRLGSVVASYYKYGEHHVTSDGKTVVGTARHVGINPNYSFFEDSYPYADVEKFHS